MEDSDDWSPEAFRARWAKMLAEDEEARKADPGKWRHERMRHAVLEAVRETDAGPIVSMTYGLDVVSAFAPKGTEKVFTTGMEWLDTTATVTIPETLWLHILTELARERARDLRRRR